jgi:HEAT repeat protein
MARTISFAVILTALLFGVQARGGEPSDPAAEVESLIPQLADADSTRITLAANRLLLLSRDEKIAPAVVKKIRSAIHEHFLRGPKPSQEVLLKIIVEKGEKFFIPDIVHFACHGPDDMFGSAVDALKRLASLDPALPDRFIAIFKNAENPVPVRVRAILAVNHLASFRAIVHLIDSRGDASPEIALAAQQSLEGILQYAWASESADWKAWWEKNKTQSESELLREAFRRAREETAAFLDARSTDANVKALDSGIKTVREQALAHLRQLRDPASIEALRAFIRREPYPHLKAQAYEILGDLAKAEGALKEGKHLEIARFVVASLKVEGNAALKIKEVEVLGKIGRIKDLDLIAPLLPLLRAESEGLRAAAANSIGKIDGPEARAAVDPLCAMLNNAKEGPDPRRNAANALGQIRDPKALPALIHGLDDQNVNVRWSSANSLGNIGAESAVDALLTRLEAEKEERVLEVLVKALRTIRSTKALAALPALARKTPTLSDKVYEAILFIGQGKAEAVLPCVDALEKEGSAPQALELLRLFLAKAQDPPASLRERLARGFEKAEKWSEAAGAYLEFVDAAPEHKPLRLPERSSDLWVAAVRDWMGPLKESGDAFLNGLAKALAGGEFKAAYTEGLVALVGNADGKTAASAHALLTAWTGRETAPLGEDPPRTGKKTPGTNGRNGSPPTRPPSPIGSRDTRPVPAPNLESKGHA